MAVIADLQIIEEWTIVFPSALLITFDFTCFHFLLIDLIGSV